MNRPFAWRLKARQQDHQAHLRGLPTPARQRPSGGWRGSRHRAAWCLSLPRIYSPGQRSSGGLTAQLKAEIDAIIRDHGDLGFPARATGTEFDEADAGKVV